MSEESTPDVQPSLESALHTELSKQFADAAPDAKASGESATPEPEPVKPEGETEPVQASPDVKTDGTPKEDLKEPPQHWPQADKEAFKTLTSDAQDFLLRREKETTADYTRKTTDLAEAKKFQEDLKPVIDTFTPMFKAYNIKPAEAIQRLLQIQAVMDNDPVKGLKWMADNYKVDLKSLQPEESDKFVDPDVQELKRQLKSIQDQLSNQETATKTQRASQASQQIEVFKAEKDATGALKYPHFEQVQESMAKFIASGLAGDLPTAYNKAVRADDELYQQSLTEREKNAVKTRDEEARLKAEQAKKTGVNIKGKGSPSSDVKPKTLHDELASHFN